MPRFQSSPLSRWATLTARLGLLTAVLLAAACSFDTPASELECSREGETRPGEVCRDGWWRLTPDASLDARSPDAISDATPDDADACIRPSARELCESAGSPCAEITLEDPCGGSTSVDCARFIDLESSIDHCGACNQPCPDLGPDARNAVSACQQGTCVFDCEPGWIDANGQRSDGCEEQCTPSNGGVEVCDQLDNDCDGSTDEDAQDAATWYRDGDGDGYGSPLEPIEACSAPTGYVANASDCDDTSDAVNPAASEVCDGSVDENCDGNLDENCPCTNGQSRECGTDEGTCQRGTQTCADGQWPDQCNGDVEPQTDICDGFDNDCDGLVDEDYADRGDACTVGQGECAATGTLVCKQDGSGTLCDATTGSPTSEVCDGLDNDCDGAFDEEFKEKGQSCTVSQGECRADGVYVCQQDGMGTVCDAAAGAPSSELCDGLDNDCDGDVDENFPQKGQTCTIGLGECEAQGTAVCKQDGSATTCNATPGTPAATETCGDGLDNDCNGDVDEGCDCNYLGIPFGVCANATRDTNGDCVEPTSYEVSETTCDGLDNDCDSSVDEGLTDIFYLDADGDQYGDASNSKKACSQPSGYVLDDTDCDDGNPATYPGAPERCDDQDNNCNGINGDDRGDQASQWCQTQYNYDESLKCDRDGPNNQICCEIDGDRTTTYQCDFESNCWNGQDDDGDGNGDCADPDCAGLYCGPGQQCQNSSCQPI